MNRLDIQELSSLFGQAIFGLKEEARRKQISSGIDGLVDAEIVASFSVMEQLFGKITNLVNSKADVDRQLALLDEVVACAADLTQKTAHLNHLGPVPIHRKHTGGNFQNSRISDVFNEIVHLAKTYQENLQLLRTSETFQIDPEYLVKKYIDISSTKYLKAIILLSARLRVAANDIIKKDTSWEADDFFGSYLVIPQAAKSVIDSRDDNSLKAGLVRLRQAVDMLLKDEGSRSIYKNISIAPLSKDDVIFGRNDNLLFFEHGLKILSVICEQVIAQMEALPMSDKASENTKLDDALEEYLQDLDVSSLKDSLPEQKISPIQFEMSYGRLAIKHTVAYAGADDDLAKSARKALVFIGKDLRKEVASSNYDKRLLTAFHGFFSKLKSGTDVIALGIMAKQLEGIVSTLAEELPDSLNGALVIYLRSVEAYLGQFQDWQRFTDNASTSNLDTDDVQQLYQASGRLVDRLASMPQLTEGNVTEELMALRGLVPLSGEYLQRAGFALLRTLENLWSRVFTFALDSFHSAEKDAAAVRLAITLTAIANENASDLIPVTSKVADSAWVENASRIVGRSLKQIEDLLI